MPEGSPDAIAEVGDVPVPNNDVVADTHSILWYLFNPARLSAAALAALNLAASGRIYLSAITPVEVAYLIDKGRMAEVVLDDLIHTIDDPTSGVVLAPITPDLVRVMRRIPRKLVPDMPDRIIAATAVHLGLPLVTADSQIRASGIAAIW